MRSILKAFSIFAASTALFAADQKKSVAILNFDYSTVQSGVAAIFGTNQDVGKGVADLLVEKLVKSGQYRVIERKAIDKIVAEQNFSNSDRADSTTAAKIGRLIGADAIVMGSITQFGRDDKKTNVGGSVVGSQHEQVRPRRRRRKQGEGGCGSERATREREHRRNPGRRQRHGRIDALRHEPDRLGRRSGSGRCRSGRYDKLELRGYCPWRSCECGYPEAGH